MKRILIVIIMLTAAASLPRLQPQLSAEESLTIRTGLNAAPGLVYNRSWDPGYNGTAITLLLLWQSDSLFFETGAEAGYSFTGINLLFPLRAGIIVAGDDKLNLSASAALMPGLILSRPYPYFLFAAEIEARLTWAVTEGFNLSLTAGPRCTISPVYSSEVAPLELIDLSLGLAAGFVPGK